MTSTTIPTTAPVEADTTGPSPMRAGVTASLVAAAAAEVLVLVARVADVSMMAADPGASSAKAIPVGGVAMAVLMNAALGLLLAVALARWVNSAARTFVAVAVAYTVLSLLGPALAAHTQPATKVVLTAAHVIAAVIIIPPVAAALRRRHRCAPWAELRRP